MTTPIPDDIRAYQNGLDSEARAICDVLLEVIERELPDADRKVWHAHPVWFFEGNPVVGYSRLKVSVQLLFWSGQAFEEAGLEVEGSFQAAQARYTDPSQVDLVALGRWLSKARDIQWNYRDIRRNQGLVPLRGLPGAPAATG
ncbi:DUF1801 domain-containing protein [Leucobacter coleopterorum]|uniref:DUF1801 domain-containing protein n=1 Tax=Leucobacter coleopterorum TaxID=2714933 RepID=A0ABX6JZA3_9MICO|nr:DUF1801 domain-containing protein [Leucobacter coleopterorum]QIM18938.1 DUF1801 domain-containing protein [Leucobacter coleopterorum]